MPMYFQEIMYHIRRLKRTWEMYDFYAAMTKWMQKNFRWKDEFYDNW